MASTAPLAPASATAPAAPEKKRVPFWDNARFACITLVVIGHGIQRLTADSNNAYVLYLFIYAFHMPAFAIVSGYFSKADPPGRHQMRKVITDILLPYAIMEIIWTGVQYLVEGKTGFNPSQPSWTLWFLLALGIFRLILPYLVLLRFPLLWAVIFSIAVGYFSNVDSTFSLSRTIGILPFFVLGWKARQWGIVDRWRVVEKQTWPIRGAAIGVLAAWLATVWVFVEQLRTFELHRWFFYDDSYTGLGGTAWWAGAVRLGLILLTTVLSAAFFVLIPRSATWMTAFGQSTMYVYLLHSFVLYPLRETGVLKGEHSSLMWLLSMVLASVAISIALSSPLVRRIFHPLVEPKADWLFARRGVDDPAPRQSRRDPTGSRRD
ncbi:fucose 4-O-acetylase-like acetyltransferase [Glaciihabitans tibetensis]|uniref:Fucose 4-O-acetylase-like acetyltransferase n=1 Tax=Glaciihabitans tibetensis TaxID=1266600 RepID=A0A2T0VH39_9MICO|nr:acyltransferase family protein [Glaciihabitans tibetensis]PRY69537.1 fucose 4-O-acetylase-like acetyltransferase [Glaciihabitans tibetensis]